MKTIITTFAILGSLTAASCSSVSYGDPNEVETLTVDYGSTDLQTFARDQAESLIAAPALNYLENPAKGADQRILVYVGGVENRTSEHIDTQAITDSIKTSLLNSGKFRIMAADQGQAEIGDQVRFQQGSGRVDPAWAKAFGKQLGAELVLYGRLIAIDKKTGRSLESGGYKKNDVYYKFTYQGVNVETGELLWINETEIRKQAETGIFG